MVKLENELNQLIDLEEERHSVSKELTVLEQKYSKGLTSKEKLAEEFRKRIKTDSDFLKQLRELDRKSLGTAVNALNDFNVASDLMNLEEIPFNYKPKVTVLERLVPKKEMLPKPVPAKPIVIEKPKAVEKPLIKPEVMPELTAKPVPEKAVVEKPLIKPSIQEEIKELRQRIAERIPVLRERMMPKEAKAPEKGGFITSMSKLFKKELPAEVVGLETEEYFKGLGETYAVLIPDYAFSQTETDEKGNKIYAVYEPKLSAGEKDAVELIKKKLIEKVSLETISRDILFKEISKIVEEAKIGLSLEQEEKIVYYLTRDMYGLSTVEPLMHDPLIEDIECDGVGVPIFIVHRKEGHLRTNIQFNSSEELASFVVKLSQLSKAYVSFASPILDAILPDGSRVNAVLTETVSTKGPTFTIRKFPEKPFSPIDLMRFGSVNAELLAYLWTAIEFKRNLLVIGPTAAGKTTLLNALAMFIPSGLRVVSIEDTRELNLVHDNWLPQVSRAGFGPPDVSGRRYGEVLLVDLIKESFRQRPDVLIVGEVRGEEAFVMFQGMSAGHMAISTIHAKTVEDVVARLITPPINLHPSLLNALDIVVAVSFVGIGSPIRKIREIDEIKTYNAGTGKVEYEKLYEWQPMAPAEVEKKPEEYIAKEAVFADVLPITWRSLVLKEIASEFGIENKKLLEILKDRTDFLGELFRKGIFDYFEFNKKLREFKRHESF